MANGISELDGQQVGTTPGKAVNETPQQNNQGLNSFDMSHYNGITTRFGDVTPFLAMETVPKDVIKFSNNHELRTPTLAAPLLSPVRMHKSYFHVPMKAIMPNTWDLIIENPKRGDDVNDLDGVLPKWAIYNLIRNYILKAMESVKALYTGYGDDSDEGISPEDFSEYALEFMTTISMLRNFCSQGCLLSALGYPIISRPLTDVEFDVAFTNFWRAFWGKENYPEATTSIGFSFLNSNNDPIYSISVGPDHEPALTEICELLDRLEAGQAQNGLAQGWSYWRFDYGDTMTQFPAKVQLAAQEFYNWLNALQAVYVSAPVYTDKYNPCKLLAYQMACCQFFSNDNVDNVHDGKLYLQNLEAILGHPTFSFNGVEVHYDIASEYFFSAYINQFNPSKPYVDDGHLWTFMNIFCYQQSLKFGDYFNSGRTRPLGIGDVSIPVDGFTGSIEAIDVTKNLAKQRFLNAVNRLGASIAQYTKGIFGVSTDQLEPQPQFLARSTSYVGNPETVNTADDQGRRTSQLSSIDGKYEFTARFNDFGYLFGLVSFDVIPCYSSVLSRENLHRDRFEFFNPMLQNIGDQAIEMKEINPLSPFSTFAYTQRYSEYKQGVNRCMGAFSVYPRAGVSNGFFDWLYQADIPNQPIDSYFLRHHRTEFDRFITGFDGVGLASHTHFAIIFNLNIVANRAMQYISTIL